MPADPRHAAIAGATVASDQAAQNADARRAVRRAETGQPRIQAVDGFPVIDAGTLPNGVSAVDVGTDPPILWIVVNGAWRGWYADL